MKHAQLILRFAIGIFAGAMLVSVMPYVSRASGSDFSAERAIAPVTSVHTVDARAIPQERFAPIRHAPGVMPDLLGTDETTWRLRKEAARFNRVALAACSKGTQSPGRSPETIHQSPQMQVVIISRASGLGQ